MTDKAYPYDPDFPYVVLNVFSDEGIARFRYESDAVDFSYEDPTMYVIDTTPKERPMTDQITAELIEEAITRAELCDADSREAMRDTGRIILRLVNALEAVELERDNWQLSAEEAERAEKRWEQRLRLHRRAAGA